MLVAVAAVALISPQLGWRAGTPTPVLEDHPRWVALYWKAWENLYAATVDEQEPGPWPSRVFVEGGSIGFDSTLGVSLYANWGWRAHPARETLSYVLSGVSEEGSAPARFGTQGSSGEASGLPIAALAAERVFRLSGDRETLLRMLSGAQRRHHFFHSRYSFAIPPASEKEKARVGYRVPEALSNLPFPQEAPGEASAEALALLLQDSALLARLYYGSGDSRSAGTSERLTTQLAGKLAELWNAKDRRFHSSSDGETERDSILVLLGGIGGKMPSSRDALLRLFDPSRYYRRTLFPTVPRTDPAYNGSISSRPLFTYLALRSLIDSGMEKDAGRAAEHILDVYEAAAGDGLNLYGSYGPETRTPPDGATPGSLEAGTIAIAALIEAVMGIDVDAKARKVTWFLRRRDKHGLQNLRFGDNSVSIVWADGTFEVEAEKPFTLEVTQSGEKHQHRFAVGKSVWKPALHHQRVTLSR